MKIIIENCSSPGASFTDNTNDVILSCYELVTEHPTARKPFIEFRKQMAKEKKINDNNARNIYPFLKNCGLIFYEKGELLSYNEFFTNIGLAYVKILQNIRIAESQPDDTKDKKEVIAKLKNVQYTILLKGLKNLLSVPDSNYTAEYIACIRFLIQFQSIDKKEFAYLLYEKSRDEEKYLDNMDHTIKAYRKHDIDIEVQVSVRNDIKLREKTGQDRRLEGIGFLSSYNYILGTLFQAGIVNKEKARYFLPAGKATVAQELIGVE